MPPHPQQMEVSSPSNADECPHVPFKNVFSSFDDQYTAPNSKYTRGECPHPRQMEVSASLKCGWVPHPLKRQTLPWKNWSESKMVLYFTLVDKPNIIHVIICLWHQGKGQSVC